MEPEVTEKARSMWATEKRTAKRAAHLRDDEEAFFIGDMLNYSDSTDTFYLTTQRLLTFNSAKPVHSFDYGDISGFDAHPKNGFSVRTHSGGGADLVRLQPIEHAALQAALETFPVLGPSTDSWQRWLARRAELQAPYDAEQRVIAERNEARDAAAALREQAVREQRTADKGLKQLAATTDWAGTKVPLHKPNSGTSLTILRNCQDGEAPWLIITIVTVGTLVAFEDRLMIIKKGLMQGLMTGAFGGERATTMYYRDITGIEYNAGMVQGVLEVLTPSYQGSANKDYWRGRTKSRNADSNDPYTLSNTLPMDKLEHRKVAADLQELRSRISKAKQAPTTSYMPFTPQPAAPDLGAQLAQLGQLRDSGVLTEDEFVAAKARLLSGPNA